MNTEVSGYNNYLDIFACISCSGKEDRQIYRFSIGEINLFEDLLLWMESNAENWQEML
jgi:hypothetical protein